MNHEKTFEVISRLKDVETELHRLKNALEMANRALDAQHTWVGLTDEERRETLQSVNTGFVVDAETVAQAIETKLKEKNT